MKNPVIAWTVCFCQRSYWWHDIKSRKIHDVNSLGGEDAISFIEGILSDRAFARRNIHMGGNNAAYF